MPRCPWATTEPNITYHDEEWGVPVHDDRVLFEFLILEGAQAGLSWTTILKKRDNYRKAFDGFRVEKIARFGTRDTKRLLGDAGIVRNRLKIAATIKNARKFPRCSQGIWDFRCLPMELRRWQTNPESLATHGRRARAHSPIRRDEPRFAATRIQIRWLNHLLRVDASNRHGQRSSRAMSATRRAWRHKDPPVEIIVHSSRPSPQSSPWPGRGGRN